MAGKGKNCSKCFSNVKVEKASRKSLKLGKVHPWRLCPSGQHWVRTHLLRIPPSKKNPRGSKTTRHGHCAHNPSGKDQLYSDEIREIGHHNFKNVKDKPCPIPMGAGRAGTQYDELIAGWTKYWNDVFRPVPPLEPNVVKALIATESRFRPKKLADARDQNSARGLMQITNKTRKILSDEKGELKDHFITVTREELNEPSNNICAGIRWLFRKREIATSVINRPASWEEAVQEFKGTRTVGKRRAQELIERFRSELEKLKKCDMS
jgi:hypothetical protein